MSSGAVYDLPTAADEHYLDAFLRSRVDDDDDDDVDGHVNGHDVEDVVAAMVGGCPALATSRASPTEKCVEFLKGAHHDDGPTSFDRRAAAAAANAECGRAADCGSLHSAGGYDVAAGCPE